MNTNKVNLLNKFIESFKKIIKYIINLSPIYRKFIFISIDISLISISFLFINLLNYPDSQIGGIYILLNTLFIISTYFISGHYTSLSRYESSKEIYLLSVVNFVIIFSLHFVYKLLLANFLTLQECINLWILSTTSIGSIRILSRDLISFALRKENKLLRDKKSISIYGTDSESIKLYESLNNFGNYKVKFFIDGSSHLKGYKIKGISIINPLNLSYGNKDIEQILVISNKVKNREMQDVFEFAKKFDIDIIEIPEINKLTSGELKLQELKPINAEDLLFRKDITSSGYKANKYFKNKSIIIIGAGGSIGSEIVKQLINYEPKKLLLFDISEVNLYQINHYLNNNKQKKIETIPILGDACDKDYLYEILKSNKIDIVFHTAAYKHVPLVENNPIQGIYNNIISTYSICLISEKLNIEKVITISTDKAVRPTNLMGASKRASELVVQAFAYRSRKSNSLKTIYSMVRFGNVLESSGSVVPLFKKQIKEGGPITITHPKITRYFMTIKEASILVLDAAIMSEGGEIFLLDMGKPVKIKELAIQMIKKSGLILKDENNSNGNIEIISTGLRPGEKLYEELLISADAEPTNNLKIFKARENFIKDDVLFPEIKNLKKAIKIRDLKRVLIIIKKLVPEWVISKHLKLKIK